MVADPEQEVRSLAKKVLWILFAVVLVLALAVAGVTGYFWYQNNHIFVEDAVYPINAKTLDLRGQDISFEHYDAVHSQLPNCEIYWDVPFQVGKYPNDTTKLTVADLTEKDIRILLNYFPKLKTLDATACSDYAVLESAKQQLPGCEILYEVNLGGKSFAPEVTELTLEVGDYDYDTLMENIARLNGENAAPESYLYANNVYVDNGEIQPPQNPDGGQIEKKSVPSESDEEEEELPDFLKDLEDDDIMKIE